MSPVSHQAGLLTLSHVRLFLMETMEPLVWLCGWLGAIFGKDRHGVAAVLRGTILTGARQIAVGRNTQFVGPAGNIRLGERVTLFGNCYLNGNGPGGFVEIGEHSHVDQFCVLYGQGGLEIGKNCAIASGVIVYSQTNEDSALDGTPVSRQPVLYAPVRIGDGCWLGTGVRVLPGVTIGEGCHVGAGSVVTGDLPPYSIAVGVPARVVKERRH